MIDKIEYRCRRFLESQQASDAAHNIDHIERVVKLAIYLCNQEGANLEVVVPAAWLHDCVTFAKNHPQRHLASRFAADKALAFLKSIHYPEEYLAAIHQAIVSHSYSAGGTPTSLEAKIVQDADRLDAIAAIGLSRCIQVGTSLERPLYNNQDPFCQHRHPNDELYTIDHFYTKLLQISNSVNTPSAHREAKLRTEFMQRYLQQLEHEIRPSQ